MSRTLTPRRPPPWNPWRPHPEAALTEVTATRRPHPGLLCHIASFTQRAVDRLSTSRSIANSAFSRRSRASSARSDSDSGPMAVLARDAGPGSPSSRACPR